MYLTNYDSAGHVEELESKVGRFQVILGKLPSTSDKWLLSSALQKSIRRGHIETAVSVATKLLEIDPAYLPRRLPIIAAEDVGIGGLEVCHDVFDMCGSSKWWRTGAAQTVAFLVSSLAAATKCRAACDALCLAAVQQDANQLLPRLLAQPSDGLIGVAADRQRPWLERALALRVLGGISERNGGTYRVLSKCNVPALKLVGAELAMPPLVLALMAKQARSGGLAAFLPLAVEAAGESRRVALGSACPDSDQLFEGLPLCGVDMFSELGRSALREFFLSPNIRRFTAQHCWARSPVRMLNMAMFHVESSNLDRYLCSDGLSRLTAETETQELLQLGLSSAERRQELYALLRSEAEALAQIRIFRLRASHHQLDGVKGSYGGLS
ncbi:hypothetical protein AABB87_15455 [Roseateles sp. PN1]